MAEDSPPGVKPNAAKRRKLAQPVRAGLNWNQGGQTSIRTSLVRDKKSEDAGSSEPVTTVLPDGSGDDESNSESGSESKAEKTLNGKPRGSNAPSVIGSSQIDLENDELYGGAGGSSTARPSKVSNGVDTRSDDDSDILQLHTDDELDRGVMINVSDGQNMELPVPEPVAVPAAPSQSPARPLQSNPQSCGLDGQQSSDEGEIPPDPPPTLADLSTADLRLQVRYFYIGRDLTTIPLSDFARCLHCASTGHLTLACPSGSCRHCMSSEHLSTFCPQLIPCSKCLEKGHTAQSCPEKLRAAPDLSSYTCPRCSRKGHVSESCEMLWRSSQTEYTDLPIDRAAFRRECYECGRSVHLGNDCDTRRPGKPLGTSSWSALAASAPPAPPLRPTAPRALRAELPPKKNKKEAHHKKKGGGGGSGSDGTSLPPPAPGLPNLPPPPAAPTGPKGKPKRGGGRVGGSISIRGVSSGHHSASSNRPAALQPQNALPPPQAPTKSRAKYGGGRGSKKKGGDRGGGAGAGGRGGRGGGGYGGGGGAGRGGGESYRPMPSAASKAWSSGFK